MEYRPRLTVLRDLARDAIQSVPLFGIALFILLLTGLAVKLTVAVAGATFLKHVHNNLLQEVARKAIGGTILWSLLSIDVPPVQLADIFSGIEPALLTPHSPASAWLPSFSSSVAKRRWKSRASINWGEALKNCARTA